MEAAAVFFPQRSSRQEEEKNPLRSLGARCVSFSSLALRPSSYNRQLTDIEPNSDLSLLLGWVSGAKRSRVFTCSQLMVPYQLRPLDPRCSAFGFDCSCGWQESIHEADHKDCTADSGVSITMGCTGAGHPPNLFLPRDALNIKKKGLCHCDHRSAASDTVPLISACVKSHAGPGV